MVLGVVRGVSKKRAVGYVIGGLITGALIGYYLKDNEPKVNFYGDIKQVSVVTVDDSLFKPKTIDFLVTTKNGDKIGIILNGKSQKQTEKLEKKTESFLTEKDVIIAEAYRDAAVSLDNYIKSSREDPH